MIERHPLHNRTLHVSGRFKTAEKPYIGIPKPDIGAEKPDIEKLFQPKTADHIQKLREAFPDQAVFGRADVMEAVGLQPSRASELLKTMLNHRIIEPVSGRGKGKYRFP